MSLAVVTGIYGGYDPIRAVEVEQDIDADWIMVSDQTFDPPSPWRLVVEPAPPWESRLRSRIPKCRPDLYTDADVVVWIDGNFHPVAADSIRWAASFADFSQLAIIRHPRGDPSLAFEAYAARCTGKYGGHRLAEQVDYYEANGYPDDWGLWESRLIVRRPSEALRHLGDAWMREMVRWASHDQIALSGVCWAAGLRPRDIDPDEAYTRFTIGPHTRLV